MAQRIPDYRIRPADWHTDQARLKHLRTEVFVKEQGVPGQLEWDGRDADALHLIAEDSAGQAIATARLLADGRIGRMAVLAPFRGSGVGRALLHSLLALARQQQMPEVHLHAQLSAVAFYQRFGFQAEGDVFEEAGIAHQAMRLTVQ